MCSVWASVLVDVVPTPDASFWLRSGFLYVPVGALVLQGPSALGEEVIETAVSAIHRDPGDDPLQPVDPDRVCKLRPLPDFMISGLQKCWMASFSASTQKSASNVFEIRKASAFRVKQSMMAARERKPWRIDNFGEGFEFKFVNGIFTAMEHLADSSKKIFKSSQEKSHP
jgi:hypothetical protein